jgi:hypothetical protein
MLKGFVQAIVVSEAPGEDGRPLDYPKEYEYEIIVRETVRHKSSFCLGQMVEVDQIKRKQKESFYEM